MLAAVATGEASPAQSCELQARFVGKLDVAWDTRVDGMQFGGISGLDYSERDRRWYLVSDTTRAPGSYFFIAELGIGADGFRWFTPRAVRTLRRPQGAKSSAAATFEGMRDAESLRVDPLLGELVIAGEGSPGDGADPWLHRYDRAGELRGTIALPWQSARSSVSGMRPNRSVEAISFAPRGRVLWIALEAPLFEDGPVADAHKGADVRVASLNLRTGATSQYVYAVDAALEPRANEVSDSGISEILALGNQRLLVLERSGAGTPGGDFRFRVRLYCADFTGATDIATSGVRTHEFRKGSKRLVLDFADVPDTVVDNFEAMAWGPRLKNGARTLVVASDNNFQSGVPTRLLLFEIKE